MSSIQHGGFLGSAYAAKSPEEIAKLYDGWAETYEAFMAGNGYRHPTVALALLSRHQSPEDLPILDAGCGTGLLGEWLGILGYPHVEALDLSEGMLAVAAKKGCYKALHKLALGGPLPFEDGTFAAIVSSGVFTTGHVGAEALDELIRICKANGVIVFTVKNELWEAGFADRVDELVTQRYVEWVEETPDYVSMPGDAATTPGHGVVLRVL